MLYLCVGLTGNKMSKILKVRNVNDYGRYLGCADQHPLVSVIDYAEVSPIRHTACTGWRQGKPSPKCQTASASNIRAGGRGNRLPSVRPPRLRISPALQPDVQEAGGGYAVGILSEGAELTDVAFLQYIWQIPHCFNAKQPSDKTPNAKPK